MRVKPHIKTEFITLNLGPQHPSTHGVLRVVLTLDGERVVKADPHLGYLHRGIEKLCESFYYIQVTPLLDRIDYLANINCELSWVMAVEKLAQIEVPPRAEYIRVILLEFNRILSHLLWYGAFAMDIGLFGTAFLYAFREREYIQQLMEMVTGARMHYHYFRFGGVTGDIPSGFAERALAFVKRFPNIINELEELVESEIFMLRTKGIGVLPKEMALNYAVSGPMLRASGVNFDLRKKEPYSVYSHFNFEVPLGEKGDCFDRYKVRMEEMRQSIKIIEQAIEGLPEGEVRTKVPQYLKPPQGEVYVRTEHPRGEFGVYLISDGGMKPYRVKIRSPSFVNLQAGAKLLEGNLIPDLIAILGSVDIVMGCIDR